MMDTNPKPTSDDATGSLGHVSEVIKTFAGIVRLPDSDSAEEQAWKRRVERHS
jgi:hypothetical protein